MRASHEFRGFVLTFKEDVSNANILKASVVRKGIGVLMYTAGQLPSLSGNYVNIDALQRVIQRWYN